MRIILLLGSLLLISLTAFGQIEIQTNFLPNINKPIDNRGQIVTLADTSTIAFVGAGVFTTVTTTGNTYVYNGTQWMELGRPSEDIQLQYFSALSSSPFVAKNNFVTLEWDNIYGLSEGSIIARDTTNLTLYANDAACPCKSGEYYWLNKTNKFGYPIGLLKRKE